MPPTGWSDSSCLGLPSLDIWFIWILRQGVETLDICESFKMLLKILWRKTILQICQKRDTFNSTSCCSQLIATRPNLISISHSHPTLAPTRPTPLSPQILPHTQELYTSLPNPKFLNPLTLHTTIFARGDKPLKLCRRLFLGRTAKLGPSLSEVVIFFSNLISPLQIFSTWQCHYIFAIVEAGYLTISYYENQKMTKT